jgi:GT2 family glycosyltransferase
LVNAERRGWWDTEPVQRPQGATATAVEEVDEIVRMAGWDFEVVVVSFHSRDELAQLIDGLPADLPIAIVDNASGADQVADLVTNRPNGRYVDSGGGKGYAKAANIGVRTSSYPYVVFANPDSRPTAQVMAKLVDDLRADPTLATVAATMKAKDNTVELGNGGWEPTPRRVFLHVIGAHKVFPTCGLYAKPTPGRPIKVDWMTGASLATRRQTFVEIGGLDERYFVYNEDVALGRRVREAGMGQKLRTDLLVPHGAGGSGAGKTWMLQMRGASMLHYLHDHNPAGRVAAMRALFVAGYLGRWAAYRLRGNRPAAAEHLAYVKGLTIGRPPQE